MDFYIEVYSKLINIIEKEKIENEHSEINEIYDNILFEIYKKIGCLIDNDYTDSVK